MSIDLTNEPKFGGLGPHNIKGVVNEALRMLLDFHIKGSVALYAQIGSSTYIETPNDVDFAVLVTEKTDLMGFSEYLVHIEGWQFCTGSLSDDIVWVSVRRGHLNLMLTKHAVIYERFVTAMEVCKALRLQERQDRIAVCQIIRDGKTAVEVETSTKPIGA